jgi:hypothetical protein
MIGDSEHEVLEDIVHYTENGIHKDKKRLEWDIYNIPHHCSYLALNSRGEKGEIETIPKEKIDKLLSYGNLYSTLISSSHTITEDYEKPQPPHIQAHNCYVKYNKKNNGRGIFVTMEYPNKEKPEPIEIAINKNGHYFTDFSDKEEYIEKYTKNINLSFDLKIECEIIQDGFRKNILSKIPFLRTDKKLRFFIESTNVPKPYSVKWKVKNKGLQARKLKQLRGEITDDDGHEEKIEHTKYIGSHYVECYILKGNVCVAKDRIEVPIKL